MVIWGYATAGGIDERSRSDKSYRFVWAIGIGGVISSFVILFLLLVFLLTACVTYLVSPLSELPPVSHSI